MKKVLLIVAAGIMLGFVLLNGGSAYACGGGYGCADAPIAEGQSVQLCVNSALLTVTPDAGGGAYVVAPADADVDFNVSNCGGWLPALDPEDLTYGGNHKLVVDVLTVSGTRVTVAYGNATVVKSSPSGKNRAAFDLR